MFKRIKADLLFSKAQKSVNKEEYDKAIELFDRAVSLNSKYSPVYIHKALVVSEKDNYKEAVELAETGISLRPDSAVYHMYLGIIHYDNKNYKEALKYFKKAMELDSENKQALCLEKITSLAAGEVEGLIEVLKNNILHTNADCKSRLLVILEKKLLEQADDEYNVSTKRHFENETLTLPILFGIMYFEMKEYSKAEENLMASIQTSTSIINYYYLGLCSIMKDDCKKAQYWFKKAMAVKTLFSMKDRFSYLLDSYQSRQ